MCRPPGRVERAEEKGACMTLGVSVPHKWMGRKKEGEMGQREVTGSLEPVSQMNQPEEGEERFP